MSYEEKRVKVKHYGTLPARSPLLVEVPGTRGRPLKLHKLAAEALAAMAVAVKRDLGLDLEAASAWRRHRWRSREHYEETLIAKYGSVRAGRRWLAFNSPHETGLAVDFGVGGLEPKSKTAKKQRTTPLHAWLVEHAHEYGWHPYKVEPWHWEHPLSLAAFKSGVRGDDDDGPASFAAEEDDDDEAGLIEEFDEDSAAWFSGEADDGDGDDGEEGGGAPRSGEIEGEFDGGDGQPHVRWRLRWRIG